MPGSLGCRTKFIAIVIPACAAFSLQPLGGWHHRGLGSLAHLRGGPETFRRCRRALVPAQSVAGTGLRMGLDEEIAAVRGMKVAEIKQELVQRGLSTNDMFEKDDFVKRLAEARASEGPKASSPSAANSAQDRGAILREEISAMQISVIKAQLAELGVASQGLFEKTEFVELLVRARLDGPASRRADGGSSSEFKDVQTKKMPRKEAAQPKQPGAGGSPFGDMGAGMPNPFAGMQGMGGQGPFAGGNPFGGQVGGRGAQGWGGGSGASGAPGGVNMQELLSKVMGNPQAMAAAQKAMQNPKVSAALADIQRNPASAAKYLNDPEIASIVAELQQYLR